MAETIHVNLNRHGSYTLDLPGLGNCGYTWVYDPNETNLVNVTHQYIVPPNPKPGERAIERFIITGAAPGKCVLQFRQIQTWDENQPPLDTRRVEIEVD